MDNNVIFKEESAFGFLEDLKEMFQQDIYNARQDNECREEQIELFEDAIKNIKELMKNEDNLSNIYECYYNPMGAFIFTTIGRTSL